jgi:NAD(P)-dependent dehydrogenase (short-subunit alcohol dehydrogenase family)
MGSLGGKHCIITGGAGSVGLATARRFLDDGAKVVLIDLKEADLASAARSLANPDVMTIAADVTRAEDVKRAIDLAIGRFGAIDVLFSNAGNFGTVRPIADFPLEVFESVYAVHVRGAFLVAKHGVPHLRDGGAMIITSSVAATRGDAGVYAYVTAKHAQVGLMRCLAKELAPRRIRVNSIHPGPIDNGFQLAVERDLGNAIGADGTEFFNRLIPMGRHATPDEIAKSVVYLASDQASFVTGTMLMVDGGMSV